MPHMARGRGSAAVGWKGWRGGWINNHCCWKAEGSWNMCHCVCGIRLKQKLMPRSRALLQKEFGPLLDKKFREFYVILSSGKACARVHHLSLSWARCVKSTSHPYPTFLRNICILSSLLVLVLSSGLFLADFQVKILCEFFSAQTCHMLGPSHPRRCYHPHDLSAIKHYDSYN